MARPRSESRDVVLYQPRWPGATAAAGRGLLDKLSAELVALVGEWRPS